MSKYLDGVIYDTGFPPAVIIKLSGKEVKGKSSALIEQRTRKKLMVIDRLVIQIVKMSLQVSKLKRRILPPPTPKKCGSVAQWQSRGLIISGYYVPLKLGTK